MTDLGSLSLVPSLGERLCGSDVYEADFSRRDAEIHGRHSWKLERRQYFDEHDDPSRDMLRRGDWDEALRLLEDERETWLDIAREDRERDSLFHRVRVVEKPLTPYLRWELHALRVQAECGMGVRVVGAERVKAEEAAGTLPEVVTLGRSTLYEVVYTDNGILDGAIRYTDPALIARWESFIKELYSDGEDVVSYVDRHIAHLPPPRIKAG